MALKNPFSFLARKKINPTPASTTFDGNVAQLKSSASRHYNVNVINQLIDSESILNRRLADLERVNTAFAVTTDSIDLSLLNSNSTANKLYRRNENWRLAYTPEISWCIDEILSELIDTKPIINFGNTYVNISDKNKQIIENEFNRFIKLFNFNDEMFSDDLRHFIIDGEFAYEAIVSQEHQEFGVIGIRRLRADVFNVIHSPILDNGFVLNIDIDALFNQIGYDVYNKYSNTRSRLVLNKTTNTYETDTKHLALTFPDVTYICYDRDIVNNCAVSLIDKAREAYNQLAALQQAALVMRITRSPERLLFNIDTGGMSDKIAAEHIRKFGNSLSKKKTVTPTGEISQIYNPSTMLESWIFGKSNTTAGTTVQSVASTANFDQMSDVNYFHNRLLNIFKIPFARITEASKQYYSGNSLTYDEARFYKFIQTMQIKFANALTKMFLRNLKLIGFADNDISNITIDFEPPERYTTFLQNDIIKNKFEVYEAFANREEFNKALLMQKYLGMSISEIKAHLKPVKNKGDGENTDNTESSMFNTGGDAFGDVGLDGVDTPNAGENDTEPIDTTDVETEPGDNEEAPPNQEEEEEENI